MRIVSVTSARHASNTAIATATAATNRTVRRKLMPSIVRRYEGEGAGNAAPRLDGRDSHDRARDRDATHPYRRLHIRRPRTTVRRPRAVSFPDALTIIDRTTRCIAQPADRNRRATRSPSRAAFRARFVRSGKPARADDERVEAQAIRRR